MEKNTIIILSAFCFIVLFYGLFIGLIIEDHKKRIKQMDKEFKERMKRYRLE